MERPSLKSSKPLLILSLARALRGEMTPRPGTLRSTSGLVVDPREHEPEPDEERGREGGRNGSEERAVEDDRTDEEQLDARGEGERDHPEDEEPRREPHEVL